jgi:hypothetical protein
VFAMSVCDVCIWCVLRVCLGACPGLDVCVSLHEVYLCNCISVSCVCYMKVLHVCLWLTVQEQ